ncbi:MAG: hypothetical protein Q4E16_07365 [Neisseria sp.]|nr:hypothetical protein [Neisseria sp.]
MSKLAASTVLWVYLLRLQTASRQNSKRNIKKIHLLMKINRLPTRQNQHKIAPFRFCHLPDFAEIKGKISKSHFTFII